MRKYFHFNKYRNCIGIEVYRFPCVRVGVDFGEDITFRIGAFVQFAISFEFQKLNTWLHKNGIYNRALEFDIGFSDGLSVRLNLMTDTMSWKRGDWNWYWNITDSLKGKANVLKKIIEERDIVIPMPEKSYNAHAILADWTWKYPRWFSRTIRRCEIDIPEGLPHPGKGENSWDCGEDATFAITTSEIRNIPEAVGQLIGSVLERRVRYGGWNDYRFERKRPTSKAKN